jgi:excisionase family DNA binding protein
VVLIIYHTLLGIQALILLKAGDVAKRLNISRTLAYKLIEKGELPSVKIRSLVRVLESDLKDYISRWRTNHLQ